MAPSTSLYSGPKTCLRCHYERSDFRHYQFCIPPRNWPEEMQIVHKKKRVVVNGMVYDVDKVPPIDEQSLDASGECLCGWVSKASTPNRRFHALIAHKRFGKAHRV